MGTPDFTLGATLTESKVGSFLFKADKYNIPSMRRIPLFMATALEKEKYISETVMHSTAPSVRPRRAAPLAMQSLSDCE